MLLAVVQPTGAATDFPDGRGDPETVAAAEQAYIDNPVQKTLEGGQFAVNRTGFEVLSDQPAFVGAEVRRSEAAGGERLLGARGKPRRQAFQITPIVANGTWTPFRPFQEATETF